MFRSLTSRFIFASILILPVFLVLSVFGLNSAFQTSLLSGEEERLKTHTYLLLGAAEVSIDSFWMPEELQEPRFNQLESGLYGVIYNDNNEEIWRSPSAKLLSLNQTIKAANSLAISPGTTNFSTLNTNNENIFVFSQDILWELESGNEKKFRFSIYHSQDEFMAESKTYQNQLWKWLGVFGLCILFAQVVILRWGLKPLKSLATDLKKIESGENEKLEGRYPSEIQPVTDNLNHVINVEKKQRERYRTTLDDLAHSLKTPLSVIQSMIENNNIPKESGTGLKDNSLIIGDQIERMNQIIQHQLQRAVLGQAKPIGNSVSILPITKRIVESLNKVYRNKGIDTSISIKPHLIFFGDERDLFELLGNIIEKAYKYSHSKIKISSFEDNKVFTLVIEDDGEGIAKEKRDVILKRGARIDTVKPGQGIGLSVALDIISSYNGSLEVEQSVLGGASFRITFPVS